MTDLTTLANFAEIIGAAIVIGGIYFAVLQMRQLRQQRRELAAIELFRFFGNPDFAKAYRRILQLPDGMSAAAINSSKDELQDAAMLICNTMENIGVMTHQRIVPFKVVNNLIGSSTMLLWVKLEDWVQSLRGQIGNPAAFEWFQWLSDMLREYDKAAIDRPGPAYVAEADWQPSHIRDGR